MSKLGFFQKNISKGLQMRRLWTPAAEGTAEYVYSLVKVGAKGIKWQR